MGINSLENRGASRAVWRADGAVEIILCQSELLTDFGRATFALGGSTAPAIPDVRSHGHASLVRAASAGSPLADHDQPLDASTSMSAERAGAGFDPDTTNTSPRNMRSHSNSRARCSSASHHGR